MTRLSSTDPKLFDGIATAKPNRSTHSDNPYLVAIIGGGPKGTYGFERLAAQLRAVPAQRPVEIHVFNRTEYFGAGDVYRPDQPDYLLTNIAIGNINMWIDEAPKAVVPNPQSLTDWLNKKYPDRGFAPTDYASRALVGQYLNDGFRRIARHLPSGVTGKYWVGPVTRIRRQGSTYRISWQDPVGMVSELPNRYQHVLLATGHPRYKMTGANQTFLQFAERHPGLGFVPFIYPVKPQLTDIPAGCSVGIKGMGLTFVDAVLALTEGKGGTFSPKGANQGLQYQPSGEEPEAIYPFSRSSYPMFPRGPVEGPATYQPHFFTTTSLDQLRRAAPDQQVDFAQQLWPLVEQEMTLAYYETLFAQQRHTLPLRTLASFADMEAAIAQFHQRYPRHLPFHPRKFLDPFRDLTIPTAAAQHACISEYLQFGIAEAKLGEGKSPWMAAVAVWRILTPVFSQFYRTGGLSPAAMQVFHQQYYGTLSRVTFGPPLQNMEKMLALAEAGILRFELGQEPTVQMDETAPSFVLSSKTPDISRSVHYLIDARIPKIDLAHNRSPLYRQMLKDGLIVPHVYANASSTHFAPGCMALSPETGNVIGPDGQENLQLTATGTPTEGVTFDNDSLSRHCNNFVSGWATRVGRAVCL